MPATIDIYDQHRAAFAQVSAYVIARNGERVATIAFKFPRDGAGRLYAYVHWLGTPMVRGWAGGCGYDKRSAACEHAMRRVKAEDAGVFDGVAHGTPGAHTAFRAALANDGGSTWDTRLHHAGFTVWQAV